MKIKILNAPEYKNGGARAKSFTAIKRYDSKDVEASLASTAGKPPILTKSGEAQPPNDWLRNFEREEVIQLTV